LKSVELQFSPDKVSVFWSSFNQLIILRKMWRYNQTLQIKSVQCLWKNRTAVRFQVDEPPSKITTAMIKQESKQRQKSRGTTTPANQNNFFIKHIARMVHQGQGVAQTP
jgi:hypothetical protein